MVSAALYAVGTLEEVVVCQVIEYRCSFAQVWLDLGGVREA